jgi:flagella basal body P-ring formation protein FlgA
LVDTAQLQSVAESALRQALSPLLGQLELHVAESLPPQSVPKGDLRIKANPVKTDMLSKRMKVHVELAVGEQYRNEITVWFDVNGQITVPVARTDIVTGTRLDETILERKVVNLGSVSLPLLYDSIPFHQMRTRHTVPGGATLTRADLEPAPTISRQQEVAVQIAANGISIETSGIALSDAELGESVRIRNPISGEDFVAQVIGPGTAQLTVR